MFGWGRKVSFALNCQEVQETKGSRNRDSTVLRSWLTAHKGDVS